MSGRTIQKAQERHACRSLPGRQLALFAVMAGLLAATSWAENDLTLEMEDTCWVQPGEAVTVFLNVSDLSESINGVQAVISYNPGLLLLSDISPGDGIGSPWDSAFELFEQVAGEDIMYAAALPATGTAHDAVVARLTFEAIDSGIASLEIKSFADSQPTFVTKLTGYPYGNAIDPFLGPPLDMVITQIGFGDSDGDDDVDFADFASLSICMMGPLVGDSVNDDPLVVPCCCYDVDGDLDIDMRDCADFQLAFTGLPD